MIDLSERLRMVASLVPQCDTAADVGTDHGYLAAWLLQRGIVDHVFATDINAGPLQRAKQTAMEQALTGRMEFYLCDGLRFPGAEAAQAMILAGMGGETMISILEAAPWTWQNTALILQPQSKQPMLYRWLSEHKIGILKARLCVDAGKRYLAFCAQGGAEVRTTEELLFRAHDPLLPDHLASELSRIDRAIIGMERSSRDLQAERDALTAQRTYLESYRRLTQSW